MKQTGDKIFIDTNILLYAYSSDEKNKRDIVTKIITDQHYIMAISTQVLNEFINVMRKKNAVSHEALSEAVEEIACKFLVSLIDVKTISKALAISKKFKYSYFDSLIIASALENLCTILYSEDMQDRQVIERKLTIINPFKNRPS